MDLTNIQAEQMVLGGVMLSDHAWDSVADLVAEADFSRHEHRLIFRALRALDEASQPKDAVTVSEWLDSKGLCDEAGGIGYIGSLQADCPSSANVRAYAEIVRNHATERRLLDAAQRIGEIARGTGDTRAKVDEAQSLMMALGEEQVRGGPRGMREILPVVVEEIDRRFNSGRELVGLSTGFTDLDRMTAGLCGGDLVIVAGRPSMGKTSFAMNIAEHAGLHGGKALIFSMEMPAEQLTLRSLASLGRIDFQRLRTAQLEDADWPKLTSATSLLADAGLEIDDTSGLSVTEMRARARRMKRQQGLDLIVVDYLQLMDAKGENRTQAISDVSRGLKGLAKELGVPVIALSQLNRSVEQRADKRPRMSDLRESGAIEQDADVILFAYRDEVYDEDSEAKGTAEIIIGKQRNGPIGMVRLTFQGQYTRFDNYAGPPIEKKNPQPKRFAGGFDG